MYRRFKAINTFAVDRNYYYYSGEEENKMPKQIYQPDEPPKSRYTPLPPIPSSEKNAHDDDDDDQESGPIDTNRTNENYNDDDGGDDDDDDLEVPDATEYDLTNSSREEIFAELSRILPQMKETVTARQAAYIGSASDKSRDPADGDELGKHLTSLDFVEAFQRFWKANFERVAAPDTSHVGRWYTAYSLLLVMWNLSDKCSTVCQRILKVQLHSDLLDFMKSDHLSAARMGEEKPSSIVQAFIGILHNVVQRAIGARESLRSCDAVERVQPYRECGNAMVSCVSLVIQAYLVTEAENEKINSDDKVFSLLVKLLKAGIYKRSHQGVNFAPIEVLEVLNKLAANDNNKRRIVKSGALPYYVDLMGAKWGPRIQAEAAHGLWILAFKCKDDIRKQDGCVEGLKVLLESTDEKVRKEAEGALWILEEKNEPVKETVTAASSVKEDGHIFISYQWDSKPVVFRIRDRLKSAGFRVWIDEDDMSGSVLDAMATAVEKAAVVVVCLSQKYKESPNCRTEAEYTFRLKKKIVPIRLQPKYYPDGWLGILVGSKLVLDFSDPGKAQENTKHLIKELGDGGKGQQEEDLVKAVSVPVYHALNYPSHDKSSPVKYWTKEDIEKWVSDNELNHVSHWFSSFTGPLLMEYNTMRQEAPETFYGYLMRNNVKLVDALAISQALKKL